MTKKPSSFFRIDEQVFFTMAGLCICCIIIFAFRLAGHHSCPLVEVQVYTENPITGNPVNFKATAAGETGFYWDFGDNNTKNEDNNTTSHSYKDPGRYLVRVMVNGQCSGFTELNIAEGQVKVSEKLPEISGADTAYLNEPVTYTDNSIFSKSWEWRFGETTGIDASTNPAKFVYMVPGPKTITVQVNGRPDLVTQKHIIVIDKLAQKKEIANKQKEENRHKIQPIIINNNPTVDPLKQQTIPQAVHPEEPAPVKPKVEKRVDISEETFKSMLLEVADGTKTAESFSSFLCDPGMQISYNDQIVTFAKMCEDLKKVGKKKIKSFTALQIHKDRETNCISTVVVAIKKKGFLGL